MNLILVRHGETDWNVEQRYQGQFDVPLNSKGQWQARQAAQALTGEGIDLLISSDLRRAHATAVTIAAACDLPVKTDRRLREINFGSWEGLSTAQIIEQDGDAYRRWKENPAAHAPTGGESLEIAERRILSLWQEIRASDMETVALVSHGGTLRILLSHLLGLPPESFWRIKLGNASLSRLHCNHANITLDALNDMQHLWADTEDQKTPGT